MIKKYFLNDFNYFYWKKESKRLLTSPTVLLETDVGSIQYKLIGKEGPVITSIHGAPGDWYQFYYTCGNIPNSKFRFLTWSRPGYVETPLKSGITNDKQADLLYALLKKLDIKKTSLIAYSNGGPIALEFTLKYPEMLDSVIMEAPVVQYFKMLPPSIIKKFIDIFMLRSNWGSWLTYADTKLFPNLSSLMFLYRYGNYNLAELHKAFKKLKSNYNNFLTMYEFALRSIAPAELKRMGIKNDTIQSLKLDFKNLNNIDIPFLILHGTKDGDVSISHSDFLASKIKNAEYHRIEGASHLISFTDAEKVADLKNNFLNKIYGYN